MNSYLLAKSRRAESVEVFLMGGLGNQLFCYSAAAYLSKQLQTDFILRRNRLRFTNQSHPGRDISALSLPGQFKKLPAIESALIQSILEPPRRIIRKISKMLNIRPTGKPVFYSNKVGADASFELISSPVILDGYFQTWKYPESIKGILFRSIATYEPSNIRSRILIDEMKRIRPLVVHVRRGDFSNPENAYFGILDSDYYLRGYSLIVKNLGTEIPVWVFSDDPSAAKTLLGEVFPATTTWIESDAEFDALDSLVSMTYGGAHLIANSTYSWWAAYLSATTRIVVAPSKWFKLKDDPAELIVPTWNTIDSSWIV